MALWIPPGGTEVAPEDDAGSSARAPATCWSCSRGSASHPHGEPHYYLTLLGTHPASAGRGIGMALLAENLDRIDEERLPAYLESSNPGNNRRYERHGFEAIGEFFPPGSEVPVTTMWRTAR